VARDKTDGKIKDYKTLLLCVDGGCEPKNPGGIASYGWVIFDKNKQVLVEDCAVVQDGGPLATNNYAEYCALGFALKWLREQNWRGTLNVQGDSQLLINQVTELWQCKAAHLKPLRQRIWEHLDALQLNRNSGTNTFTCTSCNHQGNIDTLIDVGDDLMCSQQMCPMCHTITIVYDNDTTGHKNSCSFNWVPREQNSYADELSGVAYRGYQKQKKERAQM